MRPCTRVQSRVAVTVWPLTFDTVRSMTIDLAWRVMTVTGITGRGLIDMTMTARGGVFT